MNAIDLVNCTAEGVCVVYTLIILYGAIFENKNKDKTSRLYTVITAAVLFTLLVDFSVYMLEFFNGPVWAITVTNCISICMFNVMVPIYAVYMVAYINKRRKTSYKHAVILAIISGIAIVATAAGTIAGKVFTVENGVCIEGPWYGISNTFGACCMVYILIYLLMNARILGVHDTVSMLIYLMWPVLIMIVDMFIPGLSLAYAATASSLVTLFILLQSGEIEASRMREQILREVSTMDELTGLLNRRAYERRLESIMKSEKAGYIFCDLNGLKYVNDNFGHSAGDDMITNFSAILLNHFGETETFRISGDEFAVITDMNEEEFYERANSLRIEIGTNNSIAAMGLMYGAGQDISRLSDEAEKLMYLDKDLYYSRTGRTRRN